MRTVWPKVKLGSLCHEITVGHVGPMVGQYISDGIPFLRSQDIRPFRIKIDDLKYIPPEFHRKLKKSALSPGDVVIVRTGYPGTAAVVPKSLTTANCSDLVVIRPSDNIDPWFLCCIFNSTWGKSSVAGKLVGVAQQHFNIGVAREMFVPSPPIAIQRKISAILSAYDDLIENNERRIKILEDMAQNLYREWFVKFRFPGHNKVKMVDSSLGKIPQGWKACSLGDLAKVNARSINKTEQPVEILYIDIASVTPGVITQKQPMQFSSAPGRARRIVKHGDLIWSCVRPNRRSYALILNPEPNLIASTGFAVISGTDVPFSYLYFALTTDEFVGHLVNHATGSAYPAVTSRDFESADILKPTNSLLTQFHETVAPMLGLSHQLTVRNNGLRQTRDLLLPKLISGEVDVSELSVETQG